MIMDVGPGAGDGIFQSGSDLLPEQFDLGFDLLVSGAAGSPVQSSTDGGRASVGSRAFFGLERDADDLRRCLHLPRSPGALNTPVSVSGDVNFSFARTDLDPLPITGTVGAVCT